MSENNKLTIRPLGGDLPPAAECRFVAPNPSMLNLSGKVVDKPTIIVSSVEACGSCGFVPVPCVDTGFCFEDVVYVEGEQVARSSNGGGYEPEHHPSALNCVNQGAECSTPLQFLASSLDELRFLASEDPPSRLSEGWSEAKTGRRLSRFELREALDGFFYTADEYKAHYTGTLPLSWFEMWEQATKRIPPRLSLEKGLFLNEEGEADEDEVYLVALIKPPPREQNKTRWCRLESEPGEWSDDYTGPHAYNFVLSDDEQEETKSKPARCLHSLPLVPLTKTGKLSKIPDRFLVGRHATTKPSSLIKALCLQPVTVPLKARIWHSGAVMCMKDPRTSVQPSAERISGRFRENGAKDHPEDKITTLENFCAKKKLPKPTYKNVNENREPSESHLPEWRCTLTVTEDDVYVSKHTYRKEREAMREVATSYIHNVDSSEYMPQAQSSDPAAPATTSEGDCPEAMYCSVCDMWLNGPTTFNDHTKGKKHNKRAVALSPAARFLVVGLISSAATVVDSAWSDEVNITGFTDSAPYVEPTAVLKLQGFLSQKILAFTGLIAQEIGDLTIMYNQYQASVVSGIHYAFAMFMWTTVILLFLLLILCIYGYLMCDNTSTENTAFKADADIPKCLKCSELRFEERDETNTRVFFATANEKCTVMKVALVSSRCSNCSQFPRSYGSEPVRFYADEPTSKLMHVFSNYRQSEDLQSEQLKSKKNFNGCLVGAISAMPTHSSDSTTAFSLLAGGLNSQQHLHHKAGFLPFKSWCRATNSYMQATPWNPRRLDDKGKPLAETKTLFPQRDSWEKVRLWGVLHFPWLFGPEEMPEPTAPPPTTWDELTALDHLPGMSPRSNASDREEETYYVRMRDWLMPSRSRRARELVILQEQLTRLGRPQQDSLYRETDVENPPVPTPTLYRRADGGGFDPGTFTGLNPSHQELPGHAKEVEHFNIGDPRARVLPPPLAIPPECTLAMRGQGFGQLASSSSDFLPVTGVGTDEHFADPPFDENSTSHLSQDQRHANYVNAVEFYQGSIPSVARASLEPGHVIKAYSNLSPPGVEKANGSIPTSGLQVNAHPDLVASGLITGIQGTHQTFPASRAPVLASEIQNGAKIVFVFDDTVGQTCVACGPIVGQATVWNASDPMSKLQALEHRIEVDIDPRCYCFKKCKSDVKGCRQCGEGTDGKCCSCSGELVGKSYEVRALYHMRATTLCNANLHKYRLNGCVGCDPESAGRPEVANDLEAQHCLNKVLLGQIVHDTELAALFPDGIYNDDYCKQEHMSQLQYDDYKRERIKFLEFLRERPDAKERTRAKKWAKENLEKAGDGNYPVCRPGHCPNGQPLMFRGSSSTALRYTSLWSALGSKAFSFARQIEAFKLAFGHIEEIRDIFKHTKFSPDEIEEAIFNLKMLITNPERIQGRTANSKAEVVVGKECTDADVRKNRVKYNRLTSDTKKNKARLVYDNGIELMVLSHVITKVFQILLYSKEMGIFYQYSIKEQDREETINRHLKKMMQTCSSDGKVKWSHESCMAELDQVGWERHQKEYKGRNNGLMSPIIGILRNICKNVAHFSPLLKEIATMYDNKINYDVNHGLVFDLKVPCVTKGNRGKTNIRVKLPELQVDSGWTLTSGINFASEITGVLASAFLNPDHVLCQAGKKDKKREEGDFHNVSLPDAPGIDKDNDFGMNWGGHTFNDTFKTVAMHWKGKFESLISEFLALVEGDDFAARMHRAFSEKKNSDIFENNQSDLGASAKWKTVVDGRVEMIGVHAPVIDGKPVADGAGNPLWIPDLTKSLAKLGCKVGSDNSPAAQVSRFAALAAVYYKKNLPLGTIFREAALTIADESPAEMAKATVLVKEYDELNRAGFAIGKHDMKGVLTWMSKECQGNSHDTVQEVMLMNTSIKGHPYPAENPLDFRTWGHLMTTAQSSKGKSFKDSFEIWNMLPLEMRPKFN